MTLGLLVEGSPHCLLINRICIIFWKDLLDFLTITLESPHNFHLSLPLLISPNRTPSRAASSRITHDKKGFQASKGETSELSLVTLWTLEHIFSQGIELSRITRILRSKAISTRSVGLTGSQRCDLKTLNSSCCRCRNAGPLRSVLSEDPEAVPQRTR